jgi:hypothetical protein
MGPAKVNNFFNGYYLPPDKDGNEVYVKGLRDYGVDYAELKGSDPGKSKEALASARTLIKDTFGDLASSGNISMTASQIATLAGKDDISIVAGGKLDVGSTALNQKIAGTGIYTAAGGGINIFTGGDINVNQSRVMTFMGGDMTFWTDYGDLNAGRGSSTAISASPPRLVGDPPVLVFSPPAVGSGIRALTFCANALGGCKPPPAGNIYAFAPEGKIDAGEAGIAGNRLVLAATAVLHADHISAYAGGSVGVPLSSDAGVNIGAFSGASTLPENSKMLEESSALGSAQSRYDPTAAGQVDDFIAKFLDVKVIKFDSDDDNQNQQNK